jgi:uncharacterized membrane protein
MSTTHRAAVAGTLIVDLLTLVTVGVPVPPAVRIALGMLMVFLLPGFAVVCAAQSSERQLSRGEWLLASLGISLAVTACSAVLLAATPIGLTRDSIAAVLGGITAMASAYALVRARMPKGAADEISF